VQVTWRKESPKDLAHGPFWKVTLGSCGRDSLRFGPFTEAWPGSQEAPRGGLDATQKVSGVCLSPSLIVGDAEVRTLLCGVPELSPWSQPPPPELLERRGLPFVLTDQALGLA